MVWMGLLHHLHFWKEKQHKIKSSKKYAMILIMIKNIYNSTFCALTAQLAQHILKCMWKIYKRHWIIYIFKKVNIASKNFVLEWLSSGHLKCYYFL